MGNHAKNGVVMKIAKHYVSNKITTNAQIYETTKSQKKIKQKFRKMKEIIAIIITFTLCFGVSAQSSTKVNTTDPPNLSWVVGEFEIIKRNKGEAILAPIGQPLLGKKIEVRYSKEMIKQYPWFEPTQRLILVIRNGWVSQCYTNEKG